MLVMALLLFQDPLMVKDWARTFGGHIELIYKDNIANRRRNAVEKSLGLPVQRGPFRTILEGQTVTGLVFRYNVPIGSEFFWAGTLQEHPLVRSVEWPLVGATDAEKRPSERLTLKPSRSAVICIRCLIIVQSDFKRRWLKRDVDVGSSIRAYLFSFYKPKDAHLRVLAADNNFLHVRIDHLRGEVLHDRRYWEQLDVLTIFFPVGDTFKINFLIDARYAAGMGKRPPAEAAFSNMEQEYYKQASDYLHELAAAVGTFLTVKTENKGIR